MRVDDSALSAGRDSRHCHGHGGDPHGGVLPHHNTPGPVRAATPQQRGSCIIASVQADGTGRGSRHMLIPTQQRDPQRAGTT
eukprot:6237703-Prymnesium_polylepis.1